MPQSGREVVIVEAVRTPIGRGHKEKGYYKDTHPNELLGRCYTRGDRARRDRRRRGRGRDRGLRRSSTASRCSTSGATPGSRPGFPIETPATTVDRQCGSAQQAVNFAAALIAAGVHDVVIGSGVEHMGQMPLGVGFRLGRRGRVALAAGADGALQPDPARGSRAEMIADEWEIPRSELDELALRSHQLAHRATEEGRFEREIDPDQGQRLDVRHRPGDPSRHDDRGAVRS